MKVIRKSNFDHEDHRGDQYFVVSRSLTKRQADAVADALNDLEDRHSDDFYKVVEDGYVLPPDWAP